MLYDNGGRTPPMPQRPVYQQLPQSQAVPTQRPMGPYRPQTGPFAPQRTPNESGPQYPMFQRPAYGQAPAANMQQPMYGQQQLPWMRNRRRPMGGYGVGGMGGMYGIGGMGDRDINGNSPGEWDYQQSQYPSTFTPAALYAR